MNRLLAISWAAPPYLYPRAVQVGRNLRALNDYGWACTLVAAELAGTRGGVVRDMDLAKGYLDTIDALRVPVGGVGALSALAHKLLGCKLPLADNVELWQQGATDAAGAHLDRKGADVVITYAQPWSDHLIGLELKRENNLPWVAHFSDPWVDSPYYASQPAEVLEQWRRQERQVIEAADAVIFTNAETRETVMAKYPGGWMAKAHVLEHSFDPADELPPRLSGRGAPELLYAGQFYGDRTPRPLFEAMRAVMDRAPDLPCPRVTLVGSDPQAVMNLAQDCGTGDRVRVIGRMPPTTLRDLAERMDGLLVIDAPAKRNLFLPSKLFDYLPWNRFIIGLTGEAGSTAKVLTQLGFPFAAPDDVPAITEMLENVCRAWVRDGALALPDGFADAKSEFTMARIGQRLANILSQTARL